MKRLKTVTDTGGWSRSYGYDAYGNRTISSAAGLAAQGAPGGFTGANQIRGGSYDAAGNQTVVGGDTLGYDGEGRRVHKNVNGAVARVYVYDALGQMIVEDSPNGSAGTAPCATCYLSVDHLGSPRMVTDGAGRVMALHDYLPFGEEVPGNSDVGGDGRWGPGNDNITQKFTGKERGETNLDYFGARYYAGALGRFNEPRSGQCRGGSVQSAELEWV